MEQPRNVFSQAKVEAEERRRRYLALVQGGATSHEALAEMHVSAQTLLKWRQRFPAFAAAENMAFGQRHVDRAAGDRLPFDVWRHRYMGRATAWFQAEIVRTLETAEPGSFTLILLHPESGKTTTIEDWVAWRLAYDRALRFLFATSDARKASKRVERIQRILSEDSPYREFVSEFGPFRPPSDAQSYEPWTRSFFNVAGKQAVSEERDYSVEAAGIGRQISGARCDWLVFDDIQDKRSLNLTAQMVDVIRQDWLSRPGPLGRSLAIGTRVGPNDVYEAFQDEGITTNVIAYPAILEGEELWPAPKDKTEGSLPPEGVRFFWPERYSPRDYLIMRKNAGEMAWDRNYMQRGSDYGSAPFPGELMDRSRDPLRSAVFTPDELRAWHGDGGHLVIALDPGFGVNVVAVALLTRSNMHVLDWRIDEGLAANRQIAAVVQDMCSKWAGSGFQFTHLVIEDKAFQKGLLRDDDMRHIAARFGMSIVPYNTGGEKNDPDIGVPSMTSAIDSGIITFPGAGDDYTEMLWRKLRQQFVRWRPFRKGSVLTQDLVMVTWFCFLRWRKMREWLDQIQIHGEGPHARTSLAHVTVGALPYAPTPVLLSTGRTV